MEKIFLVKGLKDNEMFLFSPTTTGTSTPIGS